MTHPKKEIAAAVEYARNKGWRIVEGGSHAWGQMYCPYQGLPVRRVLPNEHLEYAKKPRQSCETPTSGS
jgi:hypothetical protein